MTDIARPGIEGELIDLPPEPPHDHVVSDTFLDFYVWNESDQAWQGTDTQYGDRATWEKLARANRPLTVYKPIKEYK